MLRTLIEFSVRNRALVLLGAAGLACLGSWSAWHIRLDAIPDVSDVQVIVVTDYPGQNPEVVDDQVTYPLASALLAVPAATTVRGYSMFGVSFVYVLFEDGTDLYWARSRVLEQLNVVRGRLPAGAEPRIGPDATGVGWVYQYALQAGWYCPAHPRGLLHDEDTDRWYASPGEVPRTRRAKVRRVRAFPAAGECPLDGRPLVAAQQDLAQLRDLQDWYLRYPLSAVPGVAEVASLGGVVREYQVALDPVALQARGVGVREVVEALRRSNGDVGGSVVEQAETEYMVRGRAYLRGLEDLRLVPLGVAPGGTPVLLGDVATVAVGAESRRGIGELNGAGEVAGGIVVARTGANAYQVIRDVRAELARLEDGLPPGVTVVPTYDRSGLIERAVRTLRRAVIEELLVVGAICVIFLGHARSALVAMLALPVGLLASLLAMRLLGITADIMSLGGLALAVGVMVDSALVMIENAHKHLEREAARAGSGEPPRPRLVVLLEAAQEVGPTLFFSLLVVTVSFLPLLVLGGQSGRLFGPLVYTKTFAMAAGAALGVTLVPALMVLLVRGRIRSEEHNRPSRWLAALYAPAFRLVMRHPVLTLAVTAALGLSTVYPVRQLGEELMPRLEEGDLLYMPTTDPGISVGAARALLQQTDRAIAEFPEVATVHGKIGRAETATDPAPLSMIETVVQLHTDPERWRTRPVAYWFSGLPAWLTWAFTGTFWPERRRITVEELVHGWTDPDGTRHPGLNDAVRFPGLANAWPYPIENRLNMLSTGMKTPVGIKILGPDPQRLGELAARTAVAVRGVAGTVSAYADRTDGGYYLDIDIDRFAAARYGLTTGDVQEVVETAVGGATVTTTVEGLARYPVSVRYPRELRDDLPALRALPVGTPTGAYVPLADVARLGIRTGPAMIRSENAQRTAWVYVDIRGRDLGGYVDEARRVVDDAVPLPPGYTRVWSGQFEELAAANRRLAVAVPVTVVLIVGLLYLASRSWLRVGIILLAVPFSLVGAFWFLWALGYDLSLAVWVGLIALLGVDAETGQIMLLYLDRAVTRAREAGRLRTAADLYAAVYEGAVKRIRPKAMTVATDMIGLLPLLWATGTGADVTRRMVAPLIGGIAVSFVLELLVYPVIFTLAMRRCLGHEQGP